MVKFFNYFVNKVLQNLDVEKQQSYNNTFGSTYTLQNIQHHIV
jgi:hypothetical protein